MFCCFFLKKKRFINKSTYINKHKNLLLFFLVQSGWGKTQYNKMMCSKDTIVDPSDTLNRMILDIVTKWHILNFQAYLLQVALKCIARCPLYISTCILDTALKWLSALIFTLHMFFLCVVYICM